MTGYALTGSFCTHRESLEALEKLLNTGCEVVPIISERTASTDTRFGKAQKLKERLEELTGRRCVCTVEEAEKFGSAYPLDYMVVAPCTGNTLAKLACGITDTSVTMAVKAHLRVSRPTLICLASNDALSANLKNISALLNRKSVYFVPLTQDSPEKKPHSLVADFSLLQKSYEAMREGVQLRPLFK